ncbi:MAG: acyl carrier protein [Verrucomicrobiales bacterium]|nr:acyl carrier protein [Verrucomicrobiales bacterium]
MSSTDTSTPELESALLRLVNEVLPALRPSRVYSAVTSDTPLFEHGIVDSLAILHLIGTIEEHTGMPVPDHLVNMKHFHSISTILDAFT